MNKFFVLMIVFLSAVATAHAPRISGFGDELGISPFADWKEIETEHFRVTFPSELAASAQRVANLYEEAHELLAPVLKWEPTFKTQVLLVDNGDLANGLTSPSGRFGMVLLLTPPDNWFSTAYYDDWLRLLVIHEYTHFLNMDVTRGIWSITRILFGDGFLPNSLWHTWMLEGLAVYTETRFTRAGRGRSPYYEMLLRAATEAQLMDHPEFMTLDRLGGPNPWNPAGESPYFFGYQLMNQVARENADALGEMSYRSGNRFPYFINGNLENITGHEWDFYWERFVRESVARSQSALSQIKARGATPVEFLTRGDHDTLGPAVSPDGNWLAYTQASLERRWGLILRNLKTGEEKRVDDKIYGAKMSFTPDSRWLIYSAIERHGAYAQWSDLFAYDLTENRVSALTDSHRARDPNVSADGKWVTYTLTEAETTGLAVAELSISGESITVKNPRKLYWPKKYGRVSTPQFHPSDGHIAFSVKENGALGEQIGVISPDQPEKIRFLTNDSSFNRYPCFDSAGNLHYVSDRSGADNLYSAKGKPLTNLTTGIGFPTFDRDQLYALVYTAAGWNLAKVATSESANPPKISEAPPVIPAEETPLRDGSQVADTIRPVQDYSIWPSILPRQWAPFLIWSDESVYFGGQIAGFDATDRHRYFLLGAYDTQSRKADWAASYTNRGLGVSLNFDALERTENKAFSGKNLYYFERAREFSVSADTAFRWTHSSLTPKIGFNAEQTEAYFPSFSDSPLLKTRYVPSVDGVLSFTNRESSALAIAPEHGGDVTGGVRSYLETGDITQKFAVRARKYVQTFPHWVLIPKARATWASNTEGGYLTKRVNARGRRPQVFNRFDDSLFDSVPLRGYPGRRFVSRALYDGSLEYHYPLFRIFRGWYTHPIFFRDITGYTFFDSHFFPGQEPGTKTLNAVGSAIELNLQSLVVIPLSLKLEYDYGLNKAQGGESDLFIEIGLSGLNF